MPPNNKAWKLPVGIVFAAFAVIALLVGIPFLLTAKNPPKLGVGAQVLGNETAVASLDGSADMVRNVALPFGIAALVFAVVFAVAALLLILQWRKQRSPSTVAGTHEVRLESTAVATSESRVTETPAIEPSAQIQLESPQQSTHQNLSNHTAAPNPQRETNLPLPASLPPEPQDLPSASLPEAIPGTADYDEMINSNINRALGESKEQAAATGKAALDKMKSSGRFLSEKFKGLDDSLKKSLSDSDE